MTAEALLWVSKGCRNTARCLSRASSAQSAIKNLLEPLRRQVVEVHSVHDASGNCLFDPAALVNAIREEVVRADKHEP